MDEVNPMAEMGFTHDKQIIIETLGFLTPCNPTRNAMVEFIPHGGKIFDLFDRYDRVTTYVLNREDINNGTDSYKLLAPFFKAFDVSDYDLRKYYDEKLPIMKGAEEFMNYFLNVMPMFIDSRAYEHAVYSICDKTEVPISIASATQLELDTNKMSRQTCRELREIASEISKLKLSEKKYELDVPTELDDAEIQMVSALDGIFLKRLVGTEAADMISTMASVGPNEKAYALLDIRKSTQVDLDGTAYIGNDVEDFQAMDLIKDGNGLSIAFNAAELAVHGCNIAIMSEDCIAATVIVAKFYDTGIQGVFDLVDNWNREYLETADFPDRRLMDEMLARFPKKLPEVYHVTKDNVEEIAQKSDAYRKKLFKKYTPKSTTA